MSEQPSISVFVKLEYWDVYRSNVVLMAIVFRKFLYIWGFVALLGLVLSVLVLVRPSLEQDSSVIVQNARPMIWVIVLPILFVFVLPLLSAGRLLKDERLRRGVGYKFSDAGIHVETSVSKSDLSWAAIRRVLETRSSFLVFTNPNIANTLPKRCFQGNQDVIALREIFRGHVLKTKLRPE
jgi:hypothetical protein